MMLPTQDKGMLTSKCIAILQLYENALGGRPGGVNDDELSIALRHVKGMIPKTAAFFMNGRREKGFRWLGFIQGVLWSEGVYTIDEMKNHNRPDSGITKE